jgi:hypothetical protein
MNRKSNKRRYTKRQGGKQKQKTKRRHTKRRYTKRGGKIQKSNRTTLKRKNRNRNQKFSGGAADVTL